MKEVMYVLDTMTEEAIAPFVKRQTSEQLTCLISMLHYTNERTKEKWEHVIQDVVNIS